MKRSSGDGVPSPVQAVPVRVALVDIDPFLNAAMGVSTSNPVGLSFAYQINVPLAGVPLSAAVPVVLGMAVPVGFHDRDAVLDVRATVIPLGDIRQTALRHRLQAMFAALGVAVHDVRHLVHPPLVCDLCLPSHVYCTRLAPTLLDLGRFNDMVPAGSDAGDILRRRADRRRTEAASLGGLCARYGLGLEVPAPVEVAGVLTDHAFVTGGSVDLHRIVSDVSTRAAATALAWPFLRRDLVADGLLEAFQRVQMPAAFTLARMEREGVAIDVRRAHQAIHACSQEVEQVGRELLQYGVEEPLRDDRVLPVLRRQGILPEHPFLTPRGWERLGLRDLEMMAGVDPLLDLLYRYRLAYRMGLGALQQCLKTDARGRVHPVVHPLGADTGRPTFSRPNLPGLARDFRPVVVPDSDAYALVEFDYKQQEIGIMAALYGDQRLIEDFNTADVYIIVAAEFLAPALGVERTALDPGAGGLDLPRLRQWAKVMMLGAAYGLTAWGVGRRLGIPEREARRLLDGLMRRYPVLARNLELQQLRVAQAGYAESVAGLRRHRASARGDGAREGRWAMNSPVQSSGADVLKLLLPRLEALLAGAGGRLLLAPYDSVVVQLPRPVDPDLVERIRGLMIDVFQGLFPVLRPRVEVDLQATGCWSKDGRADSIEQFIRRVQGGGKGPKKGG